MSIIVVVYKPTLGLNLTNYTDTYQLYRILDQKIQHRTPAN